MDTDPITVLGIAGSLREGTHNRALLRSARSLTPENQHSLPVVLKNALDWASRPPKDPPMKGKPVAMMGATTGRYGTARAQAELRKVLAYNDTVVVNRPEVLVSNAAETFRDGELVDEKARGFVRELLEALDRWARLLRDAKKPG